MDERDPPPAERHAQTRRNTLRLIGGMGAACVLGGGSMAVSATHDDPTSPVAYTDGEEPNRSDEGPWEHLVEGPAHIYYKSGYEADAEEFQGYVSDARQYISAYIAETPGHEVEWYLYPASEFEHSHAQTGRTSSASGTHINKIERDVVTLGENDLMNTQAKREQFYRNEAATGLADAEVVRKRIENGFWNKYEVLPGWLVRAPQTYLSIWATPDWQNYNRYGIESTISDIESGSADTQIRAIAEDYGGPSLLTRWIADDYGFDALYAISTQPTDSIDDALQRELGLTYSEFESDWIDYANTELGAVREQLEAVTETPSTAPSTESPAPSSPTPSTSTSTPTSAEGGRETSGTQTPDASQGEGDAESRGGMSPLAWLLPGAAGGAGLLAAYRHYRHDEE